MTATPDEELTEQGIMRRAGFEQERATLLKRLGFVEAAIVRSKEVSELIEIARIKDNCDRIDRLHVLYRQRKIDKNRDPLFASSYTVKGWKSRRTFQENRLLKARSADEKDDAEIKIIKYAMVLERAEGRLSFNPMLGDEYSLEAQILSKPIREGFIYLAHCVNWGAYLKIGCTQDWLHRQVTLQTGTPENVRLWSFAKRPIDIDLRLYEGKFHLLLHSVRHPLGREFFRTDITSFEAAARKLQSPAVHSRQASSEIEVSLAEELKVPDL
jgi:hypothetical protein